MKLIPKAFVWPWRVTCPGVCLPPSIGQIYQRRTKKRREREREKPTRKHWREKGRGVSNEERALSRRALNSTRRRRCCASDQIFHISKLKNVKKKSPRFSWVTFAFWPRHQFHGPQLWLLMVYRVFVTEFLFCDVMSTGRCVSIVYRVVLPSFFIIRFYRVCSGFIAYVCSLNRLLPSFFT